MRRLRSLVDVGRAFICRSFTPMIKPKSPVAVCPACPQCGAVGHITSVTVGFGIPGKKINCRCFGCSHEWTSQEVVTNIGNVSFTGLFTTVAE